ncbi:MAG: hypothetical protein RL693_2557 [Verrucomicrobiota bacterium]|jgi:hypothetical protein
MKRLLIASLLLLGTLAETPVQAQQTLKPVDQAISQPDFFTFRARLQAALVRRDVEAVLAVVHKDIKNSFGGNDGIDEFKKTWSLDKPDSKLWETLATVLALGGSFEAEGAFTAPYVFTNWPEAFDAFDYMAVTGSGVRVRAEPNTSAPTLATLSFSMVECLPDNDPDKPWVSIRLPGGKTGYIDRRYVRSSIDYRASFSKIDGRWQLTFFLAGD